MLQASSLVEWVLLFNVLYLLTDIVFNLRVFDYIEQGLCNIAFLKGIRLVCVS